MGLLQNSMNHQVELHQQHRHQVHLRDHHRRYFRHQFCSFRNVRNGLVVVRYLVLQLLHRYMEHNPRHHHVIHQSVGSQLLLDHGGSFHSVKRYESYFTSHENGGRDRKFYSRDLFPVICIIIIRTGIIHIIALFQCWSISIAI